MNVVNGILVFLFLLFLVVYISGLLKPKQKAFTKSLGEEVTRKKISKMYLPILIVLFIAIGATAPSTLDQASLQPQPAITPPQPKEKEVKKAEIKEPKVEVKEEQEKQPIAFVQETRSDASLPVGQTKVLREGVNGEKTLTYTTSYESQKLINRVLKSETITTQPVSRVVAMGTYVAPAPPAPKVVPTPVSAYYKNCTAAKSAGATPVYRGQPGYGTHLDRDGDGVGCER